MPPDGIWHLSENCYSNNNIDLITSEFASFIIAN